MRKKLYELGTDTYSFRLDKAEKNRLEKKNRKERNIALREAVKVINNKLKDE